MIKDKINMFNLEMKIDYNINVAKKYVNDANDYIYSENSSLDREMILRQLEDAEYILKDTLGLIWELDELYEIIYNKNS